jgi:hypothetical protein
MRWLLAAGLAASLWAVLQGHGTPALLCATLAWTGLHVLAAPLTPLRCAALAGMLPMMAALPVMAQACSAAWRLPDEAGLALHLAAMLLPAALWRRPGRALHATLLALLLGGVAVALRWPGLAGWMGLSLLHTVAWSLACAAPPRPQAPALAKGLPVLAATAAAVLGLASAPVATLQALQVGLGLAAAVGLVLARLQPAGALAATE